MMIYFITPILGSLKNYVKYKQFNILNFLRTPVIYFLFQLILQTRDYWKILIFERWFFFIFKIIRSLWRNDYQQKKDKYKLKYNMKYN
jgi:hypothetical protein